MAAALVRLLGLDASHSPAKLPAPAEASLLYALRGAACAAAELAVAALRAGEGDDGHVQFLMVIINWKHPHMFAHI